MRTQTWLKSATLGAAVLAMIGCSDGDTTVQDANSVGNLFGDNPEAIDDNAFDMPTSGLHHYSSTGSDTYDVQDIAVSEARNGAINEDLTSDRTLDFVDDGLIAYQSSAITNGDGDVNFNVIESYQDFDLILPSMGFSNFALGDDNAVYNDSIIGGEWKMVLPNSTKENTSWIIQWPNVESTKSVYVYVYKDIGTIAYRPTINTVQDSGDASDYNAVNASGSVTTDLDEVAISYSTGTGYDRRTVSYRPVMHFRVADEKIDAPQLDVDGDPIYEDCILISGHADYVMENEDDSGYTPIGLDNFSMTGTYYWKKGIGVVHAVVTNTEPVYGYGFQSEPNIENDTNLSAYNVAYDTAFFGTESDSVTHTSIGGTQAFSGDTAYEAYYMAGFLYGYVDSSTGTAANDRLASSAAVADALDDLDLEDDDLIDDNNDEGTKRALRDVFDVAFLAGYNAGAADWTQDYTETASAADAVDAGNQDNGGAYTSAYEYNDTPVAYRSYGWTAVTNLGPTANMIDPDFGSMYNGYSNNYNGLGQEVTVYDSSRTTHSSVLPAKDAFNQDYSAYISLPVVGRVLTETRTWVYDGEAGALEATN